MEILTNFLFYYLVIFIAALQFKLFHRNVLLSTFVISSIITYLNYRYFPQLLITKIIDKLQEPFQACNLRWGCKTCDCPFRDTCPHRRMCLYNQGQGF
jgi:hypothetical protein